ncbi:MAG TPA: cysteine--tRNA ligase [Burkholderiaceae bacterium]|nr:cysteine--tRNA ligase [Burkholderiaceae bacterium]
MLQIYNSLSRRKEPFKPLKAGHVGMYVCGMTVYDYCHLGHARMLVSFDVIQRWLRQLGYQVKYVRNITDIDDKIIRRALERQQALNEVTEFFIAAMRADERALGIQSPDAEPRATQHVDAMLDIIERLKQKQLAYRADDGDVNFAVRAFPGYGKLSGKTLDDLRAGERVAPSAGKQDPLDFVLWKAAKPNEPADSKWPSPYGQGRPGWHIECSAMSYELLGMPLDIHGGGPDLKFPHHENEIAQSEGAFGGTMANYWMHCGPLMVDADKMSKSLGNFRSIRDTIAQEATLSADNPNYEANLREAEMLRFFIVRNHYRSIQNYTPDNLKDAQQALDRLYQTLHTVAPEPTEIDWKQPAALAFRQAMNDDFNTAAAVAVLFELSAKANRERDAQASGLMQALANILGLLHADPQLYLQSPSRYGGGAQHEALSEAEITELIAARATAKNTRDFERADAIRDQLQKAGVELVDKADGQTEWRRI